eukprot:SAG31_NODE_9276_length_1306_cov_0.806959_2_plen_184_part_00
MLLHVPCGLLCACAQVRRPVCIRENCRTAADSGLTIQNYGGEEVWLSGAINLKTTWKAHPGQKNVWAADLSGQGVEEITGLRINDKRAVRARYPNGCTSLTEKLPSGYLCQGAAVNGSVVDPNDGFGSNLIGDYIFPTPPTMDGTPGTMKYTEVNPDTPFRDSGASFQKFVSYASVVASRLFS